MAEKQFAKPLDWYKPSEAPGDFEGCDFMAHGLGGRYAISVGPLGDCLLWFAHDEFTHEKHENVAAAKARSEADWQGRFAAKLKASDQ